MRVMMLTAFYRPWIGGLEILVEQLTAEMVARGHECMVLTGSVDHDVAIDEVDGIRVVRVPAHRAIDEGNAAEVFRMRRAVVRTVSDFAPDVVHAHDAGPVLWMYLHGGSHHRPLVVTLHMVMTRFMPNALDLLTTILVRADHLTGVSQDVVEDTLGFAPDLADRMSVIRNGIVPPVAVSTPVPVGPPRLACIGRLVAQKGFDRAIDALAILAPRHQTLRLAIAGDGPERAALEARAVERGVSDRVEFCGLLDRDGIARLLETSTAVVMPSRYEGLPLVALEAAWAGRPVVATRAPGLAEAVLDGETGLLAGGDAPQLASAIERILRDPDLARRLGATGRETAERRYSMDACADQYEALYRRLAGERSTAAGYPPRS